MNAFAHPPAQTYIRACYGVGGSVLFYEYGLIGPDLELRRVGQAQDYAIALRALLQGHAESGKCGGSR